MQGEVFIDSKYCIKSKSINRVFFILEANNSVRLSFEQPDNYICVIDSKFLYPLKGNSLKVFWEKEGSDVRPITFCLDNDKFINWYVVMPVKV